VKGGNLALRDLISRVSLLRGVVGENRRVRGENEAKQRGNYDHMGGKMTGGKQEVMGERVPTGKFRWW